MTVEQSRRSHVSHLESAIDGTRLPAGTLQTMHEGRPLWVRYDLESIRAATDRDALASRPQTLWRYRELLPVPEDGAIVSLGETMTPLVHCPRLGAAIGATNLMIKDESRLPTGSFKARGMAMAVTMAAHLGVRRLAVPTAGNAGGAMAAYASRAGLESFVIMPEDTPLVNRLEAQLYGARCAMVAGLISDCGRLLRENTDTMGWFDVSTLREPYRIEGKKTMGLELAEQIRLATSRRDSLPHRRRDGIDRHVESVRRVGQTRLAQQRRDRGRAWYAVPDPPDVRQSRDRFRKG